MRVRVSGEFVEVPDQIKEDGVFSQQQATAIGIGIRTEIDTTPTTPGTDQTPTFTFHTIGGQGTTLQFVSIDQGTPAWIILAGDTDTYTAPTSLPNGNYTFRVTSGDDHGHTDPDPPTFDFTIAAVVPAINTTITGQPTTPSTDTTPTWSFTASNNIDAATFEVSIDTGSPSYTTVTSPYTSTALAAGDYTFRVRASDSRGPDATPATQNFTISPVVTPSGAPPFAPVSAITAGTSTITTTAQLVAAAKLSSNAGKTIGVATGTYAPIITGSPGSPAGPASLVTFRPVAGATVTFAGMDLQLARNIRFEGIKMNGGVDLVASSVPSTGLQFYGCEWWPGSSNGQFNGMNMQDGNRNILIEGCYFHDLTQDFNARYPNGNYDTGYALHLSGGASTYGGIQNIQIKSCKFNNMHNDAIQLSSFNGVLVDRCEFSNATYFNPQAHIDGIQHFGGSNLTVSNCYLHNWNEHQQFFGENGLYGGVNRFFNNLLLGGTFVNNFGFENPSGSSVNITLDHNTQTAGQMHLNWIGNGIFTVTNNIAPNFSTALGSIPGSGAAQVGTNSGNQFGSIGLFNADHESTTYPGKGYTKPTAVWW